MSLTNRDLSPFGVQLKAWRVRCHLTQQQLAEAIGVHRHAIGRWERGDFLPASKAIVLELAKHLRLGEQESRDLLEASLTALALPWSVPYLRNPYFTGREEILETLHAQLGGEQAVAFTHSSALHGLGGVGKTQIALEYAYWHALEYSAVFWIAAETEEQVVTSLVRVAEVLQLPEREEQDQQHVVAAVQRWLSTHSQWLLIVDNVEDLTLLDRWLPASRSGALLLTTRRSTLGTWARGLALAPMEPDEGLLLLLRRAKLLASAATDRQVRQFARDHPTLYNAATTLVETLGGLPLALDQAGAYLEATHCSVADYLALFHIQRAPLLGHRGEGARDHPASVATTLQLAISTATHQHPALFDLLRVCAFLHADDIPEELFRQAGEHLGTELSAVTGSDLTWNQLMAFACGYSLLSRQPEQRTLWLHRLVQAVVLDAMAKAEREQWTRRIIRAFQAIFPAATPETWGQCARLVPHLLTVADATSDQVADQALAEVLQKAATYLFIRAHYQQAELLYTRALHIQEQLVGVEHPLVVPLLNRLASVLTEQGNYEQAKGCYERALKIGEQTLGPEHKEVAYALSNLATHCLGLGNYEQAELLYERALLILERALGPDHHLVAHPLTDLASVYTQQGKYEQAELLYERALLILERALGPDHHLVAHPLTGLASVYTQQGKYEQAQTLCERALRIREEAFGPEHPHVAQILDSLAQLCVRQGKGEQAEQLYQRALDVLEQALGPEHPLVAYPLHGLARLSLEQNRYREAESLLQRALSIREQHLGKDHPETAHTLHDLALLRKTQGDLVATLSLAEHPLSICSQTLGDAHSQTTATRALHTHLPQEQTCAEVEATAERCPKEIPDPPGKERHENGPSSPLYKAVTLARSENDPLQEFLDACCELHPRAWCRSANLWQAYQQWAEAHQERYSLSRRAFIAQLKVHGCCADRTNTARIWRGIALVKTHDDGR